MNLWETAAFFLVMKSGCLTVTCMSLVQYRVEFQEVHRLNDGQVKHSPEYFYVGSLWKVAKVPVKEYESDEKMAANVQSNNEKSGSSSSSWSHNAFRTRLVPRVSILLGVSNEPTPNILSHDERVIWKGDSLIEGVPETLELLRSKGKRLVFITNNSTKSRKQYGKKFETLGFSVNEEEIFASSFAAAAYLQSSDFPKDKKFGTNIMRVRPWRFLVTSFKRMLIIIT